jgi:hypothetical protein
MKKIVIALSVFVFVLAYAGESLNAMAVAENVYSTSISFDKDPKTDGTKKDKKSKSSAVSTSAKSATSGSCSKSCDKSAKASSECGSKKAESAEAMPAPDTK